MNRQTVAKQIVIITLVMLFLSGCFSTPPPIVGGIGDEVSIGDMTITVHGIEQLSPGSSDPSDAEIYVGVHLTIKNNSSENRFVRANLGIKDDATTTYSKSTLANIFIDNEDKLWPNISAGETASGYVGYEIPRDTANLVLDFSYSGGPTGAIFLTESIIAMLEAGNEVVKRTKELAEICKKLTNSPVSEESVTGDLQFIFISNDPFSGDHYAPIAFDVKGYANSLAEVETLGCILYQRKVLQTCEYTDMKSSLPVTIDRVVFDKYALLINLEEERLVGKEFFGGGLPNPCPPRVINRNILSDEVGSSVSDDEILKWAQKHWTP